MPPMTPTEKRAASRQAVLKQDRFKSDAKKDKQVTALMNERKSVNQKYDAIITKVGKANRSLLENYESKNKGGGGARGGLMVALNRWKDLFS
jgi:hypothetical protein